MKRFVKFGVLLLSVSMILSSCGKPDAASQKVMDDIESIGEVEYSDKELIDKIDMTYSTLTDNQKEQVTNYADLLNAKDELDKLENKRRSVISANSTAAGAEDTIDVFLTAMDIYGCGMYFTNDKVQIFDITAQNSVWTVSAADPNNFKATEQYTWGSTGVGKSTDNKSEIHSVETLLAIEFAKKFPNLENVSIKAILIGGDTKAVAFTADKNTPLEEGVDFPAFVNGGFDPSFEWSDIVGVTKSGLLVGTSPMVK